MSKIYKITNNINQKVYIGKTEFSIEKRFNEHCKDSIKFSESKRPLYNAMKKYGVESFSIELIEECEPEMASERESYWIIKTESYINGYNATLGGEGSALIDRGKIQELWNQGLSIIEISQEILHDVGQISQILYSMGVTKEEIFLRRIQKISKQVVMLDKNTNQAIKYFNSTREAARFLIKEKSLNPKNENGYSSHISQVCNGKRKTCGGYKWNYV